MFIPCPVEFEIVIFYFFFFIFDPAPPRKQNELLISEITALSKDNTTSTEAGRIWDVVSVGVWSVGRVPGWQGWPVGQVVRLPAGQKVRWPAGRLSGGQGFRSGGQLVSWSACLDGN